MASLDTLDYPTQESVHFDFIARIRAAFASIVRHHRERRILVSLSRMDARLLRDMGLDPATVYSTATGTWDEVRGNRFTGFEKV